VLDNVYIDTTVQEKNVTNHTDSKLYRKVIAQSRHIARRKGIGLRQSYVRKEKALMLKMHFYRHPKRKKEAMSATRKLHNIAGRLSREVQRNLEAKGSTAYADFFVTAQAILSQTRHSNHKIYSLHEPHVKCIAKGKEHKAYEFGNKSSILLSRQGIIVGSNGL
jgi:IS5 family transposase